jgi:uncharacterized membrane protein YgdD (TMEM256/DUF423 family)
MSPSATGVGWDTDAHPRDQSEFPAAGASRPAILEKYRRQAGSSISQQNLRKGRLKKSEHGGQIDVFVFGPVVHTLLQMTSSTNWTMTAAGLLGFVGVALGAFGAHALKATLETHGSLETWRTAVLYQLVHAVALLALALGRGAAGTNLLPIAWCWLIGVVLFSGSLYALALGGPRFLGPVTPIGGLCLLAGWLLIAWNAWARPMA